MSESIQERIDKWYGLAKGYEDQVVEDEEGRLRYRKNQIVRFLLDMGDIDLNKLWIMYENGMFSQEDFMEFYRLIGYTLTGS
jgi:hypothetical protein